MPVWKCNLSIYLKIHPKSTKHLALTVEAPYPQKFLPHFQWPYLHVTEQYQILYNLTPPATKTIKLFFPKNLWREGEIKVLQRVFWEIGSKLNQDCGVQWWRIAMDMSHHKIKSGTSLIPSLVHLPQGYLIVELEIVLSIKVEQKSKWWLFRKCFSVDWIGV